MVSLTFYVQYAPQFYSGGYLARELRLLGATVRKPKRKTSADAQYTKRVLRVPDEAFTASIPEVVIDVPLAHVQTVTATTEGEWQDLGDVASEAEETA